MNTEQRIIERVEACRDEIISVVQEMVRIPSITGQEAEIGRAFYEKMDAEGLEVELVEAEPDRPNVVGRYRGQAPGKTLVFNGHMDICPPGPEEEWSFPPYEGAIVDGCLQGRGTVDMKTGTCGGLLAVKIIRDLGIPLNGDVLLTCVCDEEVGGRLGVRYLLENGYIKGDYAINCEATDLRTVDVVHKGILHMDVIIFGKSIHGSRPWLGINAIDKAVDLLVRFRKLETEVHTRKNPFLKPATLNVGTIHGGTVPNMIPGKCVIELNRRLVPGETFEEAEREIRQVCAEMAADDPEFRYEINVKDFNMPIMDTPPDSPVVAAIRRAHKLVHGQELPVGGKDAGTDAAWIVKYTGMPCPVYGPGDYIKYSLGPNEKIPVQDIVDAVKVYALSIYYLLGQDSAGGKKE